MTAAPLLMRVSSAAAGVTGLALGSPFKGVSQNWQTSRKSGLGLPHAGQRRIAIALSR
jgi:hypothetical protein